MTRYSGPEAGFVLAGRSLREVEQRTETIKNLVLTGWVVALVAGMVSVFLALMTRRAWKSSGRA